jgi:imidazole glycerol-phosphate synthase subunit HisH
VIAVVDYRAGNLASVNKALDHLGHESCITGDPEIVSRADRIILPGVGHFAATSVLEQSGLKDAVAKAINRGVPFLGICVGMQWMFEGSEEAPSIAGLGLFRGICARFPAGVKSPHVGWNQLELRAASRLLRDVPPDAFVYYTHSYRAPVSEIVVAQTQYGDAFAAVVERDNIFGVQFHPEKSAVAGLLLLRNFCEAPC